MSQALAATLPDRLPRTGTFVRDPAGDDGAAVPCLWVRRQEDQLGTAAFLTMPAGYRVLLGTSISAGASALRFTTASVFACITQTIAGNTNETRLATQGGWNAS